MIGIVDYGMGNLRSVRNALTYLNVPVTLVSNRDAMEAVDRLILPGVGAFARAMGNLAAAGLVEPLRRRVQEGVPLLGLCLGMQLLAAEGEEPVRTEGLGIVPGDVRLMSVPKGLHLPHVGWNNIALRRSHPVLHGVKAGVDFYFVHSYAVSATYPDDVLATFTYGGEFVAAVARGSAIGVQFHPEKSQDGGLKLLRNFCRWDGRC